MRATKFIILGLTLLTLLYLVIINSIFNGLYISNLFGNDSGKIDSSILNVGVGDSTKVDIVRNRWYGKIYESISASETSSKLSLFGFIPVPLKDGNSNYLIGHIILIILILITATITILIDILKRVENKEISKELNKSSKPKDLNIRISSIIYEK